MKQGATSFSGNHHGLEQTSMISLRFVSTLRGIAGIGLLAATGFGLWFVGSDESGRLAAANPSTWQAPQITMAIVRMGGIALTAYLGWSIAVTLVSIASAGGLTPTAGPSSFRTRFVSAVLGLSLAVGSASVGAQDGTAVLSPLDGPPTTTVSHTAEVTATATWPTTAPSAPTAGAPSTSAPPADPSSAPPVGAPATTSPSRAGAFSDGPKPGSATVQVVEAPPSVDVLDPTGTNSPAAEWPEAGCGATVWNAVPGQQFYDAATRHLEGVLGRHATEEEADAFFQSCVEVNRSRLIDASNPEVVVPGQQLIVPPVAEPLIPRTE